MQYNLLQAAVIGSALVTSSVASPAVGRANVARNLDARQSSFRFECDGNKTPKYEDCGEVLENFSDPAGLQTVQPNPFGNNQITYSSSNDKNCQIAIVIYESGFQVTNAQVQQGYNGVSTTCSGGPSGNNGGSAVSTNGKFNIIVQNNPKYAPSSSKKKRADDDTGYTYGVHTVNQRPQDKRTQVREGLPGGSSVTIEESDTKSYGTEFSSTTTAGIEGIISTSIGVTVSSEQSYTSSFGQTIAIECDSRQTGVIYFQPKYEQWFGALTPSGDQLTVMKPQTQSDGRADGDYIVECTEN